MGYFVVDSVSDLFKLDYYKGIMGMSVLFTQVDNKI